MIDLKTLVTYVAVVLGAATFRKPLLRRYDLSASE
jgi:hypothetical protein